MNDPVPVWEKSNLNMNEAAAYFGIGVNKLREVVNRKECEPYILWVGSKRLIRRKAFEKYLEGIYSV